MLFYLQSGKDAPQILIAISLTRREKGNFGISKLVDLWYSLISNKALVPGFALLFLGVSAFLLLLGVEAAFLLLFGVDVEGYALLFGGGRGFFAACLAFENPGPSSLALLLEEGPAIGSSLLDEGPATGSGTDSFLLLDACLTSCSLDSLLDLKGCCFFLDVGPAPDCLPISESPDDLLDLSSDLLELSLEGCALFDLPLLSLTGPLLLSLVLSFEGDLLDLSFWGGDDLDLLDLSFLVPDTSDLLEVSEDSDWLELCLCPKDALIWDCLDLLLTGPDSVDSLLLPDEVPASDSYVLFVDGPGVCCLVRLDCPEVGCRPLGADWPGLRDPEEPGCCSCLRPS